MVRLPRNSLFRNNLNVYFIIFLLVFNSSLYINAQVNPNYLPGQWKISVIDNGIFKMDMNNPGDAVHRLLMEERREGEIVTVEDSLEELEEVNEIYGQFKNFSLRFTKNGRVLFNLGFADGKDALYAKTQKGRYAWVDGKLRIENKKGSFTLTIYKLTATELVFIFSDMEDSGIRYLFNH
jgi:hypothetical protein